MENEQRNATDLTTSSTASISSQSIIQAGTVNPSCLERHPDYHGPLGQTRSRFTFKPSVNKRTPLTNSHDTEPRKGSGSVDVLFRAKEMGIKVWPLEKLQRAIRAMFEVPNETQLHTGSAMRNKNSIGAVKFEREADLSRLLKHEQINGPSDRDATVALNELIPFKGYHIYIRDMDEKTKPIIVRDYPKPGRDEYSEWPQFHSTGPGKCPFVPDADEPTRQEFERAKAREDELRARGRADARAAPRTRAALSRRLAEDTSVKIASQTRPLTELRDGGNASMLQRAKMPTKEICPPPPINSSKSPVKTTKAGLVNAGTKMFGGEPAASGMQPSNITSAIRSQMISSTAAAPGGKAGTSKVVHGLKRKVLEKNSGPVLGGIQTRQQLIDPAGLGRAERSIATTRHTRGRAPEPLIHIDEETTQSEEDDDACIQGPQVKNQQLKKALEKKNAKPGYCENCREKYDDFEDVGLTCPFKS